MPVMEMRFLGESRVAPGETHVGPRSAFGTLFGTLFNTDLDGRV